MIEEILGERRKALEDEFFRRHNDELVGKMRAQEARRESKEELARVSGITDDAILEDLLRFGIRARSVAPLALVPLVAVAWADGKMDAREEQAILEAARQSGLDPAGPGYELLEGWLVEKPDEALRAVWTEYTKALCATLGTNERTSLKADLLGRARRVAEAAGSFLGLGPKVSREEERVLKELEAAFE
jgi:hypothetical protein